MNSQIVLKRHDSNLVVSNKDEQFDLQKDEYFNDLFDDECLLMEGLDPDDLLTEPSSANEELWDIIDIGEEGWNASDVNEYLVP